MSRADRAMRVAAKEHAYFSAARIAAAAEEDVEAMGRAYPDD